MEGRRILESWKEISDYLKRSVSTCKRWEAELGLPILRLPHFFRGEFGLSAV